jgi:type IV pilus assembly protein PilO
MGNFFDKLASTALAVKLGVLVGAVALVCAGYWYFGYDEMMREKEQLEAKQTKLKAEKKDYETRKQEYLAFRKEVNDLLEEQKELIQILPKSDDIEQFIESVQAQVELSGLSKVSSVREPAVPVEMYEKIPIRMSLVGAYHQINRFFRNVGELKRIVNIEDLKLEPNDPGAMVPLTQPMLLKASFVATTFQFRERGSKGGASPAKTTTTVKAGGAQ